MVRNESRTVENVLHSPAYEGPAGPVLRCFIAAVLLLSLLAGFGRSALADGAGTPIAVDQTSGDAVATETPAATATPTETVPAAEPVAGTSAPDNGAANGASASGNDGGTPIASATATETATPVPTPEPPALNAVAAKDPVCNPATGSPAAIASGASLDYDCRYQVKLTGGRLAPAWIAIDWSVAASITGGWSVQLLSAVPNAEWSPAGAPKASLQQTTGSSDDASPVVRDLLNRAATWTFRVRITRAACNSQAAELTLALNGVARLSGHDNAAVISTTERVATDQPYKIVPTLAPIPEPSISMSGSLDFGTIGLTAAGPEKLPDPKTLTLTVTGLDRACGTWNLTMASTTVDTATGQETAAPTLKLVAVNGQPLDHGGLLLDGKQPALQIVAGLANTSAPATYQLSIALVLPDQPALAAYHASLLVSLDAAASSDGAPSATPTS